MLMDPADSSKSWLYRLIELNFEQGYFVKIGLASLLWSKSAQINCYILWDIVIEPLFYALWFPIIDTFWRPSGARSR